MSKTYVTIVPCGSCTEIIYVGTDIQKAFIATPQFPDSDEKAVLVWESGKEIGKYIDGKYIES